MKNKNHPGNKMGRFASITRYLERSVPDYLKMLDAIIRCSPHASKGEPKLDPATGEETGEPKRDKNAYWDTWARATLSDEREWRLKVNEEIWKMAFKEYSAISRAAIALAGKDPVEIPVMPQATAELPSNGIGEIPEGTVGTVDA